MVVELSGIINTDFMSKCGGTCKILVRSEMHSKDEMLLTHIVSSHASSLVFILQDIDSERPMMQVGQYVFAGEYEGKKKKVLLHRRVKKQQSTFVCHFVSVGWQM